MAFRISSYCYPCWQLWSCEPSVHRTPEGASLQQIRGEPYTVDGCITLLRLHDAVLDVQVCWSAAFGFHDPGLSYRNEY